MSDRRLLPVLVGLTMLASGCFREPAAPHGRSGIDARYLGVWDCTSAEASAESARLTVLRFDAGQYYAEWIEEQKVERYRAYNGTLKGLDILNVTEVSESAPESWSALRASFPADGSLSLELPAKRIIDMTGDGLRLRTFRREADQPSAWQAFARCVHHKE
jgi:hypothetical protein